MGFDIEGSPLAKVRDPGSPYFRHQLYVTFEDIAQGYIILKPLSELSHVEWAAGFTDHTNFRALKDFAVRKGMIQSSQCNSPKELDERFRTLVAEHHF